jgi:hypothetical protein
MLNQVCAPAQTLKPSESRQTSNFQWRMMLPESNQWAPVLAWEFLLALQRVPERQALLLLAVLAYWLVISFTNICEDGMSNGLSTASFMTGLADGMNLGNSLHDRQRQQKREDRADAIAEEDRQRRIGLDEYRQERQAITDNREDDKFERDRMMKSATQDLRAAYQTGQLPNDFFKKYSSLGMDRLVDKQWITQRQQAGQALESAFKSGSFGSKESVGALSLMMSDELAARDAKDGLKRSVAGVREVKANGSLVVELNVTGKDGKQYKAPLTKNGSSDPADTVIQVTPDKVGEWIDAAQNQAEIAYMVQQTGGDQRKLADVAHTILTGERLSSSPEYSFTKGYGKNGGDQLLMIDKQTGQYRPIGGEKTTNRKNTKGGTGGSTVLKALEQYQKDAADPDKAESSWNSFTLSKGYSPEDAIAAMAAKRRSGRLDPLSDKDMNLFLLQKDSAPEPDAAPDTTSNTPEALPPPQPQPQNAATTQGSVNSQAISLSDAMSDLLGKDRVNHSPSLADLSGF